MFSEKTENFIKLRIGVSSGAISNEDLKDSCEGKCPKNLLLHEKSGDAIKIARNLESSDETPFFSSGVDFSNCFMTGLLKELGSDLG